jgi:hypothetical protein
VHAELGTGALALHELQIRSGALMTSWFCEHWKPPDRPDQVYVIRPKTRNSRWINLRDELGEQLYPAFEERLDRLKGNRTSGILIPRDGTIDTAWAAPGKKLPTEFYDRVNKIKNEFDLPADLRFTGFRHGGITESAESGCSEAELTCLSGHMDPTIAQRYIHATQLLGSTSQKKRLKHRAQILQLLLKTDRLNELQNLPELQNLITMLAPFAPQETELTPLRIDGGSPRIS